MGLKQTLIVTFALSRIEIRQIFFRPFGPQFGLKIRGGGWFPRAPPLNPTLITTGLSDRINSIPVCNQYFKLVNN